MKYRCINGFTTNSGVEYKSFDEVESLDGFTPQERNNFIEVVSPSYTKNNDTTPDLMQGMAMGDMFNTGIPGGLDMDISTPW